MFNEVLWRSRLSRALGDIGREELSKWVNYGIEELLQANQFPVDSTNFVPCTKSREPLRTKHRSHVPYPCYEHLKDTSPALKNVTSVAFCSKYCAIGEHVDRFLSDRKSGNNLIHPLVLNSVPVPPHDFFLRNCPIDRLYHFMAADDIVEALEDGFCDGFRLPDILECLFNGKHCSGSRYAVCLIQSPSLACTNEFSSAKDAGIAFFANDDWCSKSKDISSDTFLTLNGFERRLWDVLFSPDGKPWFSKSVICRRTGFPLHEFDDFATKLEKANLIMAMRRGDDLHFFRRGVMHDISVQLATLAWNLPRRSGLYGGIALCPGKVVDDRVVDALRSSSSFKKADAQMLGAAVLSEFRSLGLIISILPPADVLDNQIWYRLIRPATLLHGQVMSPVAPWIQDSMNNTVELARLFKFYSSRHGSLSFLFSLLTNEVYQFCKPSSIVDSHQVYGRCDGIQALHIPVAGVRI